MIFLPENFHPTDEPAHLCFSGEYPNLYVKQICAFTRVFNPKSARQATVTIHFSRGQPQAAFMAKSITSVRVYT